MQKHLDFTYPSGYEVDLEKSDLKEGRIVFKEVEKQATSYRDVAKRLFSMRYHWAYPDEQIAESHGVSFYDWNNCVTEAQAEHLIAHNKLVNVATYLNEGWKPNWKNGHERKYMLVVDYSETDDPIAVHHYTILKIGGVYFKSEELALQAVSILGEKAVKEALGYYL